MTSLEHKNLGAPEENRPFKDHGSADVVKLEGNDVLKATFEPGWRWSQDVRPLAGTDTCQSPHLGYVLSGRLHVKMDDGTETDLAPDDVVHIAPGHDAWVLGEEPCVMIDFGASGYAKQH